MASSDRDAGAEAAARAALAAITPKLAEPPHALLEVPADADPAALRRAFLRLTKQFHPQRFARFSPEVVRTANEVFLTIKRAYDQLSHEARGAGPAAAAPAGAVRAAGTGSLTARTPRASTAPIAGGPVTGRTAAGAPPPDRARSPSSPAPARPATVDPRAARAAAGTAPPRGAAPGATATGPTRAATVTGTPPPPGRPPAAPRPTPAAPTTTPPAAAVTAEPPEVEAARDLLRRKLWADARQAFQRLAVNMPQERSYRALMHYARGREAAEAARTDEARAELQRALSLDPELVAAKVALDELPPPPTGGLLSRLFRR